jgi:hypothetical protein
MPLVTSERICRLARSAICLVALSGFTPLALAQTVCGSTTPGPPGLPPTVVCTQETALTGQTCGFARGGTGCTANDFVGNANVTSNTISDCHIGDVLTNQTLQFQITSSQSARFSPGLFIGEQNQNLAVAGGTCSVATFPTTSTLLPARVPFPWVAATAGDACASYTKNSTSLEQIDGLTFTCNPDVNNNLTVTFMIVYANNQAGASLCNGPANVAPENSSKCSVGGTPVQGVTVTYNANPTCTGASTVTYDPVAGTVTVKFTITNSGPDAAGPALGGDVTFQDVVPPPIAVQTATCGNPLGGAVCGAVGNAGNNVTGSITTLPVGGSVDITIVGTVAGGLTNVIDNVPTLSVNGTVVVVPGGWLNTCPASTTLSVHLQSFDVK